MPARDGSKSIKDKAKERWFNESGFKTNLSWKQFQKSSKVQDEIMSKMGERYYINPMMATWNNKAFYKNVVIPIMNKEKESAKEFLNSPLSNFEDGGDLETDSKEALRAILVPPISMSLSLILFLLTAQ